MNLGIPMDVSPRVSAAPPRFATQRAAPQRFALLRKGPLTE